MPTAPTATTTTPTPPARHAPSPSVTRCTSKAASAPPKAPPSARCWTASPKPSSTPSGTSCAPARRRRLPRPARTHRSATPRRRRRRRSSHAAATALPDAKRAEPVVNIIIDHAVYEAQLAAMTGDGDVAGVDLTDLAHLRCHTTSGLPIDPADAVAASLIGHVRRVHRRRRRGDHRPRPPQPGVHRLSPRGRPPASRLRPRRAMSVARLRAPPLPGRPHRTMARAAVEPTCATPDRCAPATTGSRPAATEPGATPTASGTSNDPTAPRSKRLRLCPPRPPYRVGAGREGRDSLTTTGATSTAVAVDRCDAPAHRASRDGDRSDRTSATTATSARCSCATLPGPAAQAACDGHRQGLARRPRVGRFGSRLP